MGTTKQPVLAAGRVLFPIAATGIILVLQEWIARGEMSTDVWIEYILPHGEAYLLAWLLLLLCWIIMDSLTRCAALATLLVGCISCLPAAANFYILQLRGEPLLPWSLTQFSEAVGVAGAAGLHVQPSMLWSAGAVLGLTAIAFWLYRSRPKIQLVQRLALFAAATAALGALVFGVYLQPEVTQWLHIYPDAWMQDRYYRYYGLVTGFMTNLTNLGIDKPEDYSEQTIKKVMEELQAEEKWTTKPNFPNSYAANTDPQELEKQPTIIYVMNESYWDASELEEYGIQFDTDLSPNLHALQQVSASGKVYSPSFGGGTCDVEFEALTGFSVSFLPTGCKPYQQHVTRPMFSLPNLLKARGYQTAAVHCFYARYWSRSTAYPNLGLDEFISLEDMHGVEKVRRHYWTGGLVSDASMTDQIIQEYESLKSRSDAPVFLHAVTMQNHTNYSALNYPDDERVRVLQAPDGMSQSTIGALEDFATGIRAADAMLGRLVEYFSQVDEPVILVFWGDHYNPIDSNYDVYTLTGYASEDSADPALHQTTLLIWSNYADAAVDLGTIAAYEISPVMMDLFGLEQPLYYQYLNRQLRWGYRSYTGGVMLNWDGTVQQTPTQKQLEWSNTHWLLQYDLMFGEEYALSYMGLEWPEDS